MSLWLSVQSETETRLNKNASESGARPRALKSVVETKTNLKNYNNTSLMQKKRNNELIMRVGADLLLASSMTATVGTAFGLWRNASKR